MITIPDKVRRKLQELPDQPGCYLMRDRRGKIIYIGKAASLRKRVQSYFRTSTWVRADPKLRGLIRSVDDFDIVVLRNEAEALLTEGQLIKDYKPRYNVDLRDDKRFLMLRIDLAEPWPQFKGVRIRRDDGAVYLGPYVNSVATRVAMDFVEKHFGLRKCAPREPDAIQHKHCLNDIVRFCSAPCIGRITREAYLEKVAAACAFLRGETPALLEAMRESMAEAAAHHHFEEAAALRDTWFMLREITHQRARVASTPEIKAEDAKAGIKGLQEALNLTTPPRMIECYDISNISGTHSVASMVCAVDGMPSPNRYRHFRIRTVHQADDPAMMAEVIRRRFERLQRDGGNGPDLLVVDGGLSQLNAARGELLLLGVTHVPVIGLAKRFEEIHVPGQAAPLRLPSDSKALYVLQRIRDEAHRFALAYHRRLRGRRLRESALDEIPGMGEKRKMALLNHFGSVLRLQRASAEEIAAVPGVSLTSAKTINEWLRARSSPGTHHG
ncbi:MAG: excinuclease ABC subunit UvrC [bacterium]